MLIEAIRAVHVLPRWRAWEAVDVPTHLVLAEHSDIPADEVTRMCSSGNDVGRTTIAGAGHDVHLDEPRAWLETLRGLL